MAKAGKSWIVKERLHGRTYSVHWRYWYPRAPSRRGRYKQVKTHKGWSRGEF